MNRKQFAVIAVFTAMETYFFNEATMAGQMLFACFWALLILRNLQTAYMVVIAHLEGDLVYGGIAL